MGRKEVTPRTEPERASTTAAITVLGNIADTIRDGFGQDPKQQAREVIDELSRAGYQIVPLDLATGPVVPQAAHDELADQFSMVSGQLRDAKEKIAALLPAERMRQLVSLVKATGADIRLDGIRMTRDPEAS